MLNKPNFMPRWYVDADRYESKDSGWSKIDGRHNLQHYRFGIMPRMSATRWSDNDSKGLPPSSYSEPTSPPPTRMTVLGMDTYGNPFVIAVQTEINCQWNGTDFRFDIPIPEIAVLLNLFYTFDLRLRDVPYKETDNLITNGGGQDMRDQSLKHVSLIEDFKREKENFRLKIMTLESNNAELKDKVNKLSMWDEIK